MQKIISIQATTLPDAWFQLVYNALEHGRDFRIDEGSFAGCTRKEFDFVVVHILRPWERDVDGFPLIPEIPESMNIPAPVTKEYLVDYAPYLLSGELAEGESYTYGQRLNKEPVDAIESSYFVTGKGIYKPYQGCPMLENIAFDEEKFLDQVSLACWTYKNHGHRNNQMCLQVAKPKDMLLLDPPCVHGDMKILTKKGYKKAKNIKEGEYVLTHKGNWKKISKTYQRLYNGKLRKLKMKGMDNELLITPEHPVYVKKIEQCIYENKLTCKETCKRQYTLEKNGRKCTNKLYNYYNDEWIESKDLKENHFVKIPILKEEKLQGAVFENEKLNDDFLYDSWTKDLFWIYGLWLAEGDYSNGIRFNLGNHKKGIEAKNRLIECCNSSLGYKNGKIDESSKSSIRIPFYSKALENEFRELFGMGALNKKIPFEFLRERNYLLESLLDGYTAGDGYYRERGNSKTNSLSTSSENLKLAFVLILLKLGYIPSVTKNYPKDSEINERKISANGYNYIITWTEDKKRESKSYIKNNKFFFNPIILNEETEIYFNGNVYNFEVEDDNSYIAENFTVHNCLRHIDTRIQDGKLHFSNVYFRSWDLWSGLPANLAGISMLQEHMANEIGVEQGEMICTSKGLHLYDYQVPFASMRCMVDEC